MFDAVIIGAGTAGMTAAIYLARKGKTAIVLEGNTYGGQIINASEIENYPGFNNISGFDFATKLYEQVLSLGGKIEFGEVTKIEINDDIKTVITTDTQYECKNVIIATGTKNRKLGIDKEDELIGKGLSYCATCDGAFFAEKSVAVVGSGDTALDDAEFLSGICKKVYIINRIDKFQSDNNRADIIQEKDNVKVFFNNTVTKLLTDDTGKLSGVQLYNRGLDSVSELEVSGLFVAVGKGPNTDFIKSLIYLDDAGYILADEDCKTNIKGIFAAGDCRKKPLRQLTTAASDGAVASKWIY